LEEIETALAQHPAVQEAVVVAREARLPDEAALLAALTALGEAEAARLLDEIVL
jgi:acyl-coenzyme A synthetase/AMP-(fatty) acid ligase